VRSLWSRWSWGFCPGFEDAHPSGILHNREATSSYRISPGDLDEGSKALLLFRGDGDVDRQGAGFHRTRAFREGVLQGPKPCLDYQA
jgi:hypothetical protein